MQQTDLPEISRLLTIMAKLRDPEHGCPWDLEQDFKSLVPYTLEEAYEVAEAIETGNLGAIKKELGDLLFQVVFYARLGEELQSFDFESIAKAISDKMVHRHPHVFDNHQYESREEFDKDWQRRKQAEIKQEKTISSPVSLMNDITATLPALARAEKIQRRAAHVGFDWQSTDGVIAKIREELIELETELSQKDSKPESVREELGDLLFSCVNLARKLDIDAEGALRHGNEKFMRRFRQLESFYLHDHTKMSASSMDEKEKIWQSIKVNES